MLTLQSLVSLPVFLSTALLTHALAAPEGYIKINKKDIVVKAGASLTGGEGCADKELKWITDGFDEMNKLFLAAQDPDFEQQCAIEFFGRPYRISNYTDLIAGNLKRAAQYATPQGNATRNPDIHIRCDDPIRICEEGSKEDGKHTAYNIGNEPHINFCETYFALDPLDEKVDEEANEEQTKLALMNYYNRATVWARMVMHISDIGSAVVTRPIPNLEPNATRDWILSSTIGPMKTSVLAGVQDAEIKVQGPNIRALKYAYGATRAKLLATLSTQNAYDTVNNAENYALYAQARYVESTKGFFPSMPIMDFGNDMAVLTNDQIQDGDKKKYAYFDMEDVLSRYEGTSTKGRVLLSSAVSLMSMGYATTMLWVIVSCLGVHAISYLGQ